jgi:ribosomal protein L23
MGFCMSIDKVKAMIDDLARKGIAYAVGLYPYLYSYSSDYEYINVMNTLEPAFGNKVAREVYSRLCEVFKGIDKYANVRVGEKEERLRDYLRRYILEEHISLIILTELEKRFDQMLEDDRKVLSVACATINLFKDKRGEESYPEFRVYSGPEGFIEISSVDGERFSKVISSVLGFEKLDVRSLFCKYLLGFKNDWSSRNHSYSELKIYPFAVDYINILANKVSNYIKIPSKSEIEYKLREVYKRGELHKLSVIDHALSTTRVLMELWLLEYFFGKPYDVLCDETVINGIISKGFVNPLIYGHVKDAMKSLYFEALDKLVASFSTPFKRIGYTVSCSENLCTFTKALARPIYVRFVPWPKLVSLSYYTGVPEAIKVIVFQGIPSQSILQLLQYLQQYSEGALWLFVEGGKVIVVSSTYKSEDHKELLSILSSDFSIEFLGPVPEELAELQKPMVSPYVKYVNIAKDVLEGIVAGALEVLGFSVKVDHKVTSKAGTEVEVDVWGEKIFGDTKFITYASCKNWDNPVDIGVVREEFGRIFQMPLIPHVRILVAPMFTESAEKEAITNGFVVIEVDEKATKENMENIYGKVYEELNKLFSGVAPKWMQDLAEKVKKIADEIRKIGYELERAGSTSKL